MKKITLLIVLMFTLSLASMAQVIEDFVSLKMNLFSGGTNGELNVVPNPDTANNSSFYVGKMVRGQDGDPWAGWYADLTTTVNPTQTRYLHIKMWKTRISPVGFKLEGNGTTGDIFPIVAQSLVNQWEDLVFDLGTGNVDYPRITLLPDFITPVGLTEDITIYFDNIYLNNNPAVGSTPTRIIEDFEIIPLNLMLNDPLTDLSTMTLVQNPDKSGINQSDYVIEFLRDKDGWPWGGFWSPLPEPVDVTTNKYVHVMVWKSRISPLRFKLEGGPSGTLEVLSSNDQKLVNVWEEMVFDFSTLTGLYPVIAFMPDFEEPLTLTEDIKIYFDNIVINNNPNVDTTVTFIVNMSYWESVGKFDPAEDFVDVAGTFNDWGTNPVRLSEGVDGRYYATINNAPAGSNIDFKFRINGSWADSTAEFPAGGPNRTFAVEPGTNLFEAWYNDEVLGIVNPLVGKIAMYPNPVSNELLILNSVEVKEVIITSMLGQIVGTYQINGTGRTSINTSAMSSGLYFVSFIGRDGSRLIQKLIKN